MAISLINLTQMVVDTLFQMVILIHILKVEDINDNGVLTFTRNISGEYISDEDGRSRKWQE